MQITAGPWAIKDHFDQARLYQLTQLKGLMHSFPAPKFGQNISETISFCACIFQGFSIEIGGVYSFVKLKATPLLHWNFKVVIPRQPFWLLRLYTFVVLLQYLSVSTQSSSCHNRLCVFEHWDPLKCVSLFPPCVKAMYVGPLWDQSGPKKCSNTRETCTVYSGISLWWCREPSVKRPSQNQPLPHAAP